MTAAAHALAYALLTLGGLALVGGVLLKRADDAHARFNDAIHEETPHA